MKKPARGGLWYCLRMEFSDYMLWKALALVALAFLWGIYCGWTGRELNGQKPQQAPREEGTAVVRSQAD